MVAEAPVGVGVTPGVRNGLLEDMFLQTQGLKARGSEGVIRRLYVREANDLARDFEVDEVRK